MSLMLAATGAAGFVASFLMLRLGLSAMWLRYALAVLFAYLVFLLLLRVWLFFHSRETFLDLPDLGLDFVPDVIRETVKRDPGGAASSFGGAGDFGGGGDGGGWGGGGVSDGMRLTSASSDVGSATGGGGGSGGGGVLDSLDVGVDDEGCVFLLLALALIVAGTLAALYVVYAAPLL